VIIFKGQLYDSKEQDGLLSRLEPEIERTRMTRELSVQKVIDAIDRLGKTVAEGAFEKDIAQLNMDGIERYIDTLLMSIRRENIEYKVKTELGEDFFEPRKTNPPFGQKQITVRPMPLGTLLHIAAGNVDGLPAFSVAEGLLTGNVNILKLPQADNGLSIKIIMKLIEIEPEVSEFIYVFDTPSSDVLSIKKMADISDGIVVWGGDAAVAAVRQFASPGCRIIEWGHKLGFAYISGFEDKAAELKALAEHIITTRQLLCSSCQTIFIDTENLEEVRSFCSEFLPILDAAAKEYPFMTIDAVAERTLRRYNRKLEDIISGETGADQTVYQGNYSSLTVCSDRTPELSEMFGNCLVKRLPEKDLFSALRETKGYLQTAGLICTPEKRSRLTDLILRSGVVRVTRAGDMSSVFSGEAHDGEYPLRRYTRITNTE